MAKRMADFRLPAAPHGGIVAVAAGRQPASLPGCDAQPGILHAGLAREELREQDFVRHSVDFFERARHEFGSCA